MEVKRDDLMQKANELLELYFSIAEKPFPVNMRLLASLAGIKVKKKYMMDDCSGQLVILDHGVFAYINIFDSEQRQNFTIGHEIAHSLFPNFKQINYRTIQVQEDVEEEKLCDELASELLIPSHEFQKKLAEYGEELSSIKHLAKYFNASLEAIAYKFAQYAKRYGVILSISDFHPSKTTGLRVTKIFPFSSWDSYIPKGISFPPHPGITESFFKGKPEKERMYLELGPLKGNFFIETLPGKFQFKGRLYNKGYLLLMKDEVLDH